MDKKNYSYLDKLYLVLKGYKASKVEELAYSTLKMTIEEKTFSKKEVVKEDKSSFVSIEESPVAVEKPLSKLQKPLSWVRNHPEMRKKIL